MVDNINQLNQDNNEIKSNINVDINQLNQDNNEIKSNINVDINQSNQNNVEVNANVNNQFNERSKQDSSEVKSDNNIDINQSGEQPINQPSIEKQPDNIPQQRHCSLCGALFAPAYPGQIFCKDECEAAYKENLLKDPLINYLSGFQFHHNIFVELEKAATDPDVMAKIFSEMPTLLALKTMGNVFDAFDPNRDISQKDHAAFSNLIKWFIMKYVSDPVWHCYIGWFIHNLVVYSGPHSNFPIRTSPRFHIDNFITRDMPINFHEENKKVDKPTEIFKRIRTQMKEERISELTKVTPNNIDSINDPIKYNPPKTNPIKPRKHKKNRR